MTIPASYSESRHYSATVNPLADAVEKALNSVGWKHERTSADAFQGRRPMSFWSWGEKFTINLDPRGDVTMRSVCRYPLQIVAWGKNQRNVKRFFAALDDTAT